MPVLGRGQKPADFTQPRHEGARMLPRVRGQKPTAFAEPWHREVDRGEGFPACAYAQPWREKERIEKGQAPCTVDSILETHTQIAPDRRPGTCSYRNSTVRCCQMLNHHHARHGVSDSMVQNIRALSRGALVRSIKTLRFICATSCAVHLFCYESHVNSRGAC